VQCIVNGCDIAGLFLAGDVEAGGSSSSSSAEQHCRRPNGSFEYNIDDLAVGSAGRPYRSTPAAAAAAADGPISIPVSTHASFRERSPTRANGSRSPHRQQQQQWHQQNGWLAEEDLGLVGLGSSADCVPVLQSGQQQQHQQWQQQQQQQRLSVEMSSLPSSTPNSSRSSGTPASQQQEVDSGAAGSNEAVDGRQSSPTAGAVGQQAFTAAASDSDSEAEGASPSRLHKPRKASRLQKASM
jgi:hypothetical protein